MGLFKDGRNHPSDVAPTYDGRAPSPGVSPAAARGPGRSETDVKGDREGRKEDLSLFLQALFAIEFV